MILVAYRHGLRVSELCDLRWEQVDFRAANLHVRRVKRGTPATHPITGRELRALRQLKRETEGPFVFVSERKSPFTTEGFSRMLQRAAKVAGIKLKVHAHMLRHGCGYKLAKRHRYQSDPRVSRASVYRAHHAIHNVVGDAVQGFLARLIGLISGRNT